MLFLRRILKKGTAMFKKRLLMCLLMGCLWAVPVTAQEAFWAFDDDGREMIIPPECDETFDADELYEIGMRLLNETGYVRQGAAYCLLASAFAGNVDAQYQVANMYHKGLFMPKSDLAAYKWATLAALNGSEEADRLGANIEQFLSIQDIEVSTNSLGSLISGMTSTRQEELALQNSDYDNLKAYLKMLKEDIADLENYGKIRSTTRERVVPVRRPKSYQPEMPNPILVMGRVAQTVDMCPETEQVYVTPGDKGEVCCPADSTSAAWDGSGAFACCQEGTHSILIPSRGDSVCCPESSASARWLGGEWNDYECCPPGTVETENKGKGDTYICCAPDSTASDGVCRPKSNTTGTKRTQTTPSTKTERARAGGSIFSASDLKNAPMPTY